MEYTINKLAKLSGVSTRTLRYYDEIGLLPPARIAENSYRMYGQSEVDLLQQILFYRELSVPLEKIGQILNTPDFDKRRALDQHLSALLQRRKQIEVLIENVTKTIDTLKGGTIMTDKEKFEGFKKKIISENEEKYGTEIRERFGDNAMDSSNAKLSGMTEEQWKKAEELSTRIHGMLETAFAQGDPTSEIAQKICALHRQWICMYWKDGAYSKEAHKGLAQMYVADERFTAYYDKIAPGCAKFLKDAIDVYCS